MSAEKDGYILVSCGGVQGKLIMNKFICPGIHQHCIEVDGKLLTPKAFCVLGEKERLKDWKNAIRINGKSIRRSMYARDIDFYKHNEICTGRCMSRNYGPSKYEVKIENLRQANADSNGECQVPELTQNSPDEPAYNILREVGNGSVPGSLKNGQLIGQVVFPGQEQFETFLPSPPARCSLIQPSAIKKEVSSDDDSEHSEQRSSLLAGSSLDTHSPRLGSSEIHRSNNSHCTVGSSGGGSRHRRKLATPQRVVTEHIPRPASQPKKNGTVNTEHESKIMQLVAEFPDTDSLFEDGVVFWQRVKDIGVLDSVVRDIKQALDNIKNDMSRFGVQEQDADKLSVVVKELGLVTKLKWRLAEHKARTESEKDKLLQEIEELKMRVAESEQRQEELKRKSECFESLLDARPSKQSRNGLSNNRVDNTKSNDDGLLVNHTATNSPLSSMTDGEKSDESDHS